LRLQIALCVLKRCSPFVETLRSYREHLLIVRRPMGHLVERSGSRPGGRVQRISALFRQPHGSKSKIRRIDRVQDAREAKEFLISKIVAEAQRENAPLSETERKMLYFTESGWTLPDIAQVSEQFDREFDQDGYEKKIARIIAKAYKHVLHDSRDKGDKWWDAVQFLRREDHYISVLIGLAGLRPRWDQWKLLAAGLAIVACILVWIILRNKEIFLNR